MLNVYVSTYDQYKDLEIIKSILWNGNHLSKEELARARVIITYLNHFVNLRCEK